MKRTTTRTACITRWRCGYGWSRMHRRAKALMVKGDDAFKDSYGESPIIDDAKPKKAPATGRCSTAPWSGASWRSSKPSSNIHTCTLVARSPRASCSLRNRAGLYLPLLLGAVAVARLLVLLPRRALHLASSRLPERLGLAVVCAAHVQRVTAALVLGLVLGGLRAGC